jgi:hypothetical protein
MSWTVRRGKRALDSGRADLRTHRWAQALLCVFAELAHRAHRSDLDEDKVFVDDGAVPCRPVVDLAGVGGLLGAISTGTVYVS